MKTKIISEKTESEHFDREPSPGCRVFTGDIISYYTTVRASSKKSAEKLIEKKHPDREITEVRKGKRKGTFIIESYVSDGTCRSVSSSYVP